MSKHKATKHGLPAVKRKDTEQATKFPIDAAAIADGKLMFSFARFDRKNELFNLGDRSSNTVKAEWYIDLLDCLKEASQRTVTELTQNPFCLHPVNWETANAKRPADAEQYEYHQFRIGSRSKGRVIGFLVRNKDTNIFFVVWLDPHHNLTDCVHYEKAKPCPAAKSLSEIEEETIK